MLFFLTVVTFVFWKQPLTVIVCAVCHTAVDTWKCSCHATNQNASMSLICQDVDYSSPHQNSALLPRLNGSLSIS